MDAVKVIAEPRRREILRLCWHGERSAGDLAAAFDITFGAVSQHLKVLRDAELVTVRRAGTRRYYRANRAGLGPLAAYLEAMWAGQVDRLATLAETAETAETADTVGTARTAAAGGPEVGGAHRARSPGGPTA